MKDIELKSISQFELSGFHYAVNRVTNEIFSLDHDSSVLLKRALGEMVKNSTSSLDKEELLGLYKELGLAENPEQEIPATTTTCDTAEPITTIDLHVTNQCNLACVYCYGRSGEGYVNNPKNMTWETAKKTVDFMMKQIPQNRKLGIIFFGGEPLLNLEVVFKVMDYIEREYNGRAVYSLTTNGTLLDRKTSERLSQTRVSLMLSIDGGPKAQAKLRPFRNGRSTAGRVEKNLSSHMETGARRVAFRSTVCSANRDLVKTVDYLAGLGAKRVVLGFESNTNSHDFVLSVDDFIKEMGVLTDTIIERIANGKTMEVEVDPLFTMAREIIFNVHRIHPCGAGRSYLAVSPEGDFYPCHRFMDDETFLMGGLNNGRDKEMYKMFLANTCNDDDSCKACIARYVCSGGCPHSNMVETGLISKRGPLQCRAIVGVYQLAVHLLFRLQEVSSEWYDNWIQSNKNWAKISTSSTESSKEEGDNSS